MGCGSSKEAEKDKNPNEIESDFKETKIPAFDELFNKAKELLEQAEELRAGLQDAPEEGKEIAETWRLKEYSYTETVRVAFWALSSNAKGKIADSKLEVKEESPFIGFDNSNLFVETVKLVESIQTFLKAAAKAPLAVPEIVEKLQGLADEAAKLGPEAPAKAKEASLPLTDQLKAVKNTAGNSKKLANGLAKIKELAKLLPEAAKTLKDTLPHLKELYKTADEVGAKAHESGDVKPDQIFNKYHQGTKKTEAEIAAEKGAAENAAKEKKAKKEAEKKAKQEKKEAEKKAKEEKKKAEKEKKEKKAEPAAAPATEEKK